MAEYREAGRGGIAKSTVAAQKSAFLHFPVYLDTTGLNYTTMAEHEVCNEALLRQFETYMTTTAVTKKIPSKRDSAYKYCNSVIQTISKRFKETDFLSSSNFVSEVRADIV